MSKKRVLIIGAGRGQTELYRAVKKLGHTAVAASIKGDYPGFDLADEITYTDISDKYAVDRAVREMNADAVVTACIDVGIEALGYVCEKHGFRGISAEAGALSGNKLPMKEFFDRAGIPSPRYRKVSSLRELADAAKALRFPLIVKAADLQGSLGVTKAEDGPELEKAFAAAMAVTREDCCLVEEFITGTDCGAQAFVSGGKIRFILPTGNISFRGGTNIPVGHYVPFEADEDIGDQIGSVCRSVILGLGLDDCAVNFDLIISGGRVYVIEFTARLGANCLPELIDAWYGTDIYGCVAAAAVGELSEDLSFRRQESGCVLAKMIVSPESGTLLRIDDRNAPDADVLDLSFFAEPGDEIHRFEHSRHCVGQVIVRGENLETCEKLADSVINNIEMVLEK